MNAVEEIKWWKIGAREWYSDCGDFVIQDSPTGYFLIAYDEDFARPYVVCDVATIDKAKLKATILKAGE